MKGSYPENPETRCVFRSRLSKSRGASGVVFKFAGGSIITTDQDWGQNIMKSKYELLNAFLAVGSTQRMRFSCTVELGNVAIESNTRLHIAVEFTAEGAIIFWCMRKRRSTNSMLSYSIDLAIRDFDTCPSLINMLFF